MKLLITRVQFKKFISMQKGDMIDINRFSKISGLSVEIIKEISNNYEKYTKKYGGD